MVKAARVQRARARALHTAIDRQTAAHDAADSSRDARSRRIRAAKRDVQRALSTRDQLQQSIRATDAVAGHAVRRLLDEGLSTVDAAVLIGLSRSQVKRVLRAFAGPPGPGTAPPSTGSTTDDASSREHVDRDTSGAARNTITERNAMTGGNP